MPSKHANMFGNIEKYLDHITENNFIEILDKYGKIGVAALQNATPMDTEKTAQSWSYTIKRDNGSVSLSFSNSNIQNGVPIALVIQYGHATPNGGYVEGVDYINPALKPVFYAMANDIQKEVKIK